MFISDSIYCLQKFDFPNGGLPGDDDDEVEMDDDALLAYLKACSNEGLMEKSLLKPSNELPSQQDSKDALINELRDELGEVIYSCCFTLVSLRWSSSSSKRAGLFARWYYVMVHFVSV